MESNVPTPAVSKKALWAGRVLSTLPVLMLLLSGVMKLVRPAPVVEGFAKFGYPESLAQGIGILELVCTALYVWPRTAVLGAILLTGYLGGATATHVRIGDPFFAPILFGVLLWLGLVLRDARLRALLPLRADPAAADQPGRFPWLRRAGWVAGAAVVTVAVVAGLLPAEFRVTRTATMAAAPAEVFAQVNDFHRWEAWSPWAKLDPAAKNGFEGPAAGTGAVFTWNGNDQIGEGRMTILESRPGELIRIKLDFVRPFASTCAVDFTFRPEGGQTAVTWTMHGQNDYVARLMCLVMDMDKMVGGDFERGLAQMKAVAEAAARSSASN
jgi:hypothetical protein